MTSSGSLKELSRAISNFLADPKVPLPDDLSQVVDAYLHKHQKYDDAASDRLQEELHCTYDKLVKDTPAAWAPWLAILRRLLPILRTPGRIFGWWDICADFLEATTHDKDVVTESFGGMMDIITLAAEQQEEAADGDISSSPFIDRMFTGWIDRYYPALKDGSRATEFNERLSRDALVQFGKKHPKSMFCALNRYFVQKQYRKAALRLMANFLQSQPPHLHVVLQTPLFSNLLKCLQHDNSTSVISGALTVLTMLLPHMPSSLVPHLPTLFNIYARLLFWSREQPNAVELSLDEADQTGPWEIYDYETEVQDEPVHRLLNYYTTLYGLYPINFMDYIRKPQRYLRHANVANADEVEVQPTEIRHQSEKFRRLHLLHPNFYTLTIDSEKTDFSRWIKSEVAEVVAECTGLCLSPESNGFSLNDLHHLRLSDDDESPNKGDAASDSVIHTVVGEPNSDLSLSTQSLNSDSGTETHKQSAMSRQASQSSRNSNRDSIETKDKDAGPDSPTLPPLLAQSASHTQLQDMMKSNKAVRSGLNQSLTNDSVPSLALSHPESMIGKPANTAPPTAPLATSPASMTEMSPQLVYLQWQILQLQIDLDFEKYLKQLHMAYIGELRRRRLEEAATEAETQNLVITNRNLKNRYDEAKKAEMQVKRDSEKSRTLAKKWEADLSSKLKNLRDESKKSKAEIEALHKELESRKLEIEQLRDLVCEAEVKELNLRQNIQSIEINKTQIDKLEAEISRLTLAERDHHAKELERQRAINSTAAAEEKEEVLKIKLAARESEVDRTKILFQSQIETLQARLSEAEGRGRSAASRTDISSALAGSREKQAELQKQYDLLKRKYTALQSSFLDIRTEQGPGRLRIETSNLAYDNTDYLSMSASPVMMKTRPHRVLSNPDALEGAAFNVTQPLDSKPGTPVSAVWSQRTGSPPVMEGSRAGSLSMSPDQRPFGRTGSGRLAARSHSDLFTSGLQSRFLREPKDKHKDEGDGKKEKKSSGLRGIRGFI